MKSIFEHFDFHIFNRAALHSEQIIFFINLAPINNLADFVFQDMVEPNAGAATVTLTERVGNVHLNILRLFHQSLTAAFCQCYQEPLASTLKAQSGNRLLQD